MPEETGPLVGSTLKDQLQDALDSGALDALREPGEGEELQVVVAPKKGPLLDEPNLPTGRHSRGTSVANRVAGQEYADAPAEAQGPQPQPQPQPAGPVETPVPQLSTPVPAEQMGVQEAVQAPEVPAEVQGPEMPVVPDERYDVNAPASPASLPTGTPELPPEMVELQEARAEKAKQESAHQKQAAGESEAIKKLRLSTGDPVGPEGSNLVDENLAGTRGLRFPEMALKEKQGRERFFEAGAADTLARDIEAGTAKRGEERSDREMRGNFSKDIRGIRAQGAGYGTPILFEAVDAYNDDPGQVADWLHRAQQAVAADRNAELAINQVLPYGLEVAKAGAAPETLTDAMFEQLQALGHPMEREQYDRLMSGTNKALMSVAAGAVQDQKAKRAAAEVRGLGLKVAMMRLESDQMQARMALDQRNVHGFEGLRAKAQTRFGMAMDDLRTAIQQRSSLLRGDANMQRPTDPALLNDANETIAMQQALVRAEQASIDRLDAMGAQAGVQSGLNRAGPAGYYTQVKTNLFNKYLWHLAQQDLQEAPQTPGGMSMQAGKAQRFLTMLQGADPSIVGHAENIAAIVASPEGQALRMEYEEKLRKELEGRSTMAQNFRAELKDMYLHERGSTEAERVQRREYWRELVEGSRSEP